MKAFFQSLLVFFFIFSAVGPFFHGEPVQAEAVNQTISLPFKPNDTAINPNKPVIYATKLGSKSIYEVNFSTGEIKTLSLPNPAERLDFNNNKLYITQQKMSHDSYNFGPYTGAIAEIDPESFTVSSILDIDQDPYDIAVDNNGYIYISPGSGQHKDIKVYSMKEKQGITQNTAETSMYEETNIFYNQATSKIYSLDRGNMEAYEVVNGVIQKNYHAWFNTNDLLNEYGKFSPDGMNMYNTSGNVFDLATDPSKDMTYRFSFGKKYNDFEFSLLQQLTFAASTTRGIDVYQYGTNKYLYALRKDLNVQKLYIQNGILVTINKDSSGNYFIETMSADTQPTSGLPSIPSIPDPAGTLNNLGFKPIDTAIDPTKPVVYMTRAESKTIYAVNVSTGEIKALALPYPAERLELFNNKLYVTQQKMAKEYYSINPLVGAIAEVDTETFTATKLIDVDADPNDIAIDENGYVYIAPRSHQITPMKVYSLATGGEIPNTHIATMDVGSYLNYNPKTSKIYSISPTPMQVDAYEVKNGVIQKYYNSPRHGDYPLQPFAKITPDGLSMYNNSGFVFNLAMNQTEDMTYAFTLGRKYSDYEFSVPDKLTFASRVDGGIDVYQYNTNKYLYTIRKDLIIQKLHYQNGQLVAICIDAQGKYLVVKMDAKTQGIQDVPSLIEKPGTQNLILLLESSAADWNGKSYDFHSLYDGVKDVPLKSYLSFQFAQSVYIKDYSKITLKGPEGTITTYTNAIDDMLTIVPDRLKGSTTYTLTIKKDALGASNYRKLENDIVIQFTTASNWELHDGIWYYYDSAIGDYQTGWKKIADTWYYFDAKGEMQTGWEKVNNVWYYFAGSGAMQTGWLKQGTTWYYLTGSGAMKTGWQKVGTTWYYFQSSGAMKTGWLQLGKDWYYLYNSGAMAYNTKIGGCKLGSTGVWIK